MRAITINDITFDVEPLVPSWPDFWDVVAAGDWEPRTFRLMNRFLAPGWRWVDIGAWIGPTALYAAARGASVDAYECDPVALSALRKNVRLNHGVNVSVYDYAIGAADGLARIWSDQFGNSETSMYCRRQSQGSVVVKVRDALEVFRDKGYASDLKTIVKIDVEGAEQMILARLVELFYCSRCIWCVSFHNPDGSSAGEPVVFNS